MQSESHAVWPAEQRKTWHGMTGHGRTRQDKTRQGMIKKEDSLFYCYSSLSPPSLCCIASLCKFQLSIWPFVCPVTQHREICILHASSNEPPPLLDEIFTRHQQLFPFPRQRESVFPVTGNCNALIFFGHRYSGLSEANLAFEAVRDLIA